MVAFGAWICSHGCVSPKSNNLQKVHDEKVVLGTFYHTTKALLTEYLTSYTNTLQLIDCQYFIQCKILQISPTRILHNIHAATRHKHGRKILRYRGTEKSVAPTDFSTSLWRIIYCIRPCWLRGSGVRCVRCVQGCVRYFEIILHSWNIWISACYVHKV